ncbi:MAG: hypothetical protein ACRDVP_12485 [Acidimicrobiales bacterium]
MRRIRALLSREGSGARDSRKEAISLVIAYVKQETIEPLRGLVRFVFFGTVGSAAIGFGTILILVAILRVLQTETGAFHGDLSWLPYLIVAVIGCAVVGLAVWRIASGPAARRRAAKSSD